MQGTFSLETIAEIAIALAGFSGLIAMVRSGPVHEWHPRVRLAFWISLGWSIACVVLCLLPSLVAPVGVTSWAPLNAVACLVLLVGLGAMTAAHRELNRTGAPTQSPWHWIVNILIIAIGVGGTAYGITSSGDATGFAWFRFGAISSLLAAMPGFLASFRVRGAPAAN